MRFGRNGEYGSGALRPARAHSSRGVIGHRCVLVGGWVFVNGEEFGGGGVGRCSGGVGDVSRPCTSSRGVQGQVRSGRTRRPATPEVDAWTAVGVVPQGSVEAIEKEAEEDGKKNDWEVEVSTAGKSDKSWWQPDLRILLLLQYRRWGEETRCSRSRNLHWSSLRQVRSRMESC